MEIENPYEQSKPIHICNQQSSSSSMIINPKRMIFSDKQKDHVTQSRDLFWSKVYQFPRYSHSQSFFNNPIHPHQTKCSETAQQSWGKFNPQKQVSFEFDIYRMLREDRQKLFYTNNEIEEKQNNQRQETREINPIKQFLQIAKPPPFMGAFSHLKAGFSFFNMNTSLESDPPYKPYYSSYQPNYCQKQLHQNKNLEVSKISSIQSIKKYQKKQFFQMESIRSQFIQNEADAFKDWQIKESRIINKEDADRSMFWHQVLELKQESSFRREDPIWQEGQSKKYLRQSSIFQISRQQEIKSIHQLQSEINLIEQMKEVLSDQFVLLEISKMLQNVQCNIFTLDYRKMQWSLQLSKFRLEYCFSKNSLNYRLKQILTIANQRSRIDKAIQYIRMRPFRKVYYQLSVQITQILILFESIVLSQTQQCNFIEFLLQADKLNLEISFIYKLLINQSYISEQFRSFEDFDYRYLNSQYLIFKELVRQSKFSDSLKSQIKCLVQTLLKAAFEPIIAILNNIIFEQCTIIELNDQIYLKYYFQNFKEIGNFISKKIGLIKQQNNQIYMICKMKEKIQLLHNLTDLEQYENRWQKNYLKKRKLIERLRKNFKLKAKSQRQRKEQERMRFIYSLKSKFYNQIQEENYKKRQQSLKNREELEKLKKQINQRQERRKLLEIIEKEKEKGLLLDIQLLQKQKLKREKQRLSKQINSIENASNINTKMPQQQRSLLNEQKNSEKQEVMQIQQLKETIIKKQSQKQRVESQQQIKSLQSIESQPAVTADHFFIKNKGRNSSLSSNLAKTDCYFKLKAKPVGIEFERDQSDVSMDEQESKSSDSQEFQAISTRLQLSHDINLTTSLQICINQVIKKQVEIIQQSLYFIIKDKYQILTVISFLKNVFVSGNGEKIQQFIHIAINEHSHLNLKYFSECLLFDTNLQIIQRLQPSFYHSKVQNRFNTQINIFEENLQNYIGFQFSKMPVILQPYFSYIHLSKYMQIFSFMVRVKYCSNLVTQSWKMLNIYKKQLQLKQREGFQVSDEKRLMKKLYNIRYIINHFLNTFQSYMFFKIVEKEFKILKLGISNLHDLEHAHLKMLDNIIKFSFIDNPTQNSSKNFRKNLNYINDFYQIVAQITLDDLPGYKRNETEQRVKFIYLNFKQQNAYIQSLIAKLT